MAQSPVNKRFLLGCMYFFLVNGAMVLMTSSLLVYLMRDYQLSYDEGGLLLSIQAIGSLLSNFLSGPLSVWIGRKKTLLITAAGFCLGFAGIALTPPIPVLYCVLFITGLAWGSSNNMINFLVVRATNGDSSKISLVHTCFSIGAFIAPLLVALSVRLNIGWQWPAALVALMAFILFFVTLMMPIQESAKSTGQKKPVSLKFLKEWRLYLYMLMLFTYVGVETGFSGWLVTYLSTWRNFAPTAAQSMLSCLWIAIIVGRISIFLYGSKLKKAPFLMIEAIGISSAALLLILSSHPALLIGAVILLGLSMAGFYGMVVTNASSLVAESSVASGLMMSLGGLGATVMPLVAGLFANSSGIVAGLWALFIATVLLFLLTVLNVSIRAR
ncbi:MAG: MFS transporter [Clostridiaceae bacterium]|nr:MFS transporter [Clostridiaceae bacterium]